jgi:transketolase
MTRRAPTDLRSPDSFDHVGRDADSNGLVMGRVLAEIAEADERIHVATADLTYVTQLDEFSRRFPDRFLQFGISERNMFSAAAGMAASGLRPYVATFGSFAAILGYECIRTDMAYPALPVRVLATHSGISMGFFGTSHHATEDIAALRAIAGLTILSAPDGVGLEALLRASVDYPGPVYFRIGRGRDRVVYEIAPERYAPGGPPSVVASTGTDVLVVATGTMVAEARDACDALADDGVGCTLLDVHTLKPFDVRAIADHAAGHALVVTVEEHTVEGGLGTLVCEAVASHGLSVPVFKHGLYDEFGIIGPPSHLYRYYGLDAEGLQAVVRRAAASVGEGLTPVQASPLWTDSDKEDVLRYAQSRDVDRVFPRFSSLA